MTSRVYKPFLTGFNIGKPSLALRRLLIQTIPLWFTLIVMGVVFISQFNTIVSTNDGHFVYGLDDAYIHMAMARSLSQDGVWGVTAHEISSSSSSLLFTTLLALVYLLFGVNDYAPLILNVLSLIGIVASVFVMLHKRAVHPVVIILVLLGVAFFLPSLNNAFTGMEHLLHGLLLMLFIYQFVNFLASEQPHDWKSREAATVYVLAFLLGAVRYEALFSIAVACALLVLRGRLKPAIAMASLVALPLVLHGVLSISTGGLFLPNSVYLKGQISTHSSLESILAGLRPDKLASNLSHIFIFSPLFLILYMGLAMRQIQMRFWYELAAVAIWMGTIVLHASMIVPWGRYGFYMYFGALAPLSLLLGAFFSSRISWRQVISKSSLVIVPVVIVFLLPMWRAFREIYDKNLYQAESATNQIYLQQYQMAKFLSIYYPDATVAANDIGAITFYTNIRLLDLVGLGSNEIAHLMKDNRLDREAIAQAVEEHQVDVIVIYDSWFGERIPENWIKVTTWTIPRGGIVGDTTVSFYAREAEAASRLLWNLVDFHTQLPEDVAVSYEYEMPLLPTEASIAADVVFGESIQLNDWQLLDNVNVRACQSLRVMSWWEKVALDRHNYSLSLVLVDANGQGIARTDARPGRIETTLWEGKQTYVDVRALTLPCDLQPGAYSLLFVLYDPLDTTPLNLYTPNGQPLNQSFHYLTTIFAEG